MKIINIALYILYLPVTKYSNYIGKEPCVKYCVCVCVISSGLQFI